MSERKEKFTPGPWIPCEDGLVDKMVVGGDYDLIIDITHKNDKRNDADAYLIAAAPEMYELLKRLKLHFAGVPHIQKEIKAILQKARGEK